MLPPEELHDEDGLAWRVRPLGPGAASLEAAAPPSPELSRRLAALRAALWARRPRSVHDLVPAYTSLLAEYRAGAKVDEVLRWLAGAVAADALASVDTLPAAARADGNAATARHEITVRYGEEADRTELEARLGRPFSALARAHAAARYTVAFLGFTPGFPYLLGLPESLALPRREAPRAKVPAGAVAIADGQAGIYPSTSPGGWWVLGRTDATLFDPRRWPPTSLAVGDELRFVAARGGGPHAHHAAAPTHGGAPAQPRREAVLEVLHVWPGAATLQATPRWGVAAFGMAQAGPLDALAHAAAQDVLGDGRRSVLVELTVPILTARALAPAHAVVTGGGARVLVDGHEVPRWQPFALAAGTLLEITPGGTGATSYLGVAGGLAPREGAPAHDELLRSSSTDVRAAVGGFGRALEAGDVLMRAGRAGSPGRWPGRPRYGARAILRLHPGPQHEAPAFAALIGGRFELRSRDRTGARLDGPAVPVERPDVRSQGVPWGAVQVPGDGQPIVLLADRGRTGGYAVPAVVDPRDLWQLAQARPGSEVWFVPATR
jgi:KipI family sensor histidine kinase inhibitor